MGGEGHWAEMVQGLGRAFLGDGDDGGVVPQHGDNASTHVSDVDRINGGGDVMSRNPNPVQPEAQLQMREN